MVLVSKLQKVKVYQYLLAEGVLYVKKDTHLPMHRDLQVPNLLVMMLMKSMLTKKYVSEVFSWQYSYYTLTIKGIRFLREFLGVKYNVVPDTYKNWKLQSIINYVEERPIVEQDMPVVPHYFPLENVKTVVMPFHPQMRVITEIDTTFTLFPRKVMDNRLMSRKQMTIDIFHRQSAPSNEQIAQEIAKKFKADPRAVVIYGTKSKFGGGRSNCFCFIYDSFDIRKKLDSLPRQRKLGLKGKKNQIRNIRKSLRRRQKTVRGVAKTKVQAGAKKQKKKKE